jgi:hypothetical protein
MLTFTLDTNCLIAVDENRAEASAIRSLSDAHRQGRANVAIVGISASERQTDGNMLDDYSKFTDRVASLNMSHLPVILPMCYWDVMFWDACIEPDAELVLLEARIQQILFPTVPCSWADYCQLYDLDPEGSPQDKKWKNAKCDVQAFWCHASQRRSIFVTTDKNFHTAKKKPKLLAVAPGRIEFPDTAALLVAQS